MSLDRRALARELRHQDGVVARRQLLAIGATANDIRRMRRRRELTAVHDGVYVDHTGPLSRRQREWAAVLALWRAALHRQSALDAAGLTRDRRIRAVDEPVHVAVDASRTPVTRPGVRVERVVGLQHWVLGRRSPPRTSTELALLKVAADRTESGAIALLADGCGQGLTTAGRLMGALERLPRLPGRRRLLAVIVELDGRFGHTDTDDRWDDLDRDLAAAVSGDLTLRLGWRQVIEPCRTAAAIGALLRARGWAGEVRGCAHGCPADGVGAGSPRGPDPTRTPLGA